MSEDDEYECSDTSEGSGHYRHSSVQIQKLEEYFEECQHPNERQRLQLGRELGLTKSQIKFWFQNKRTHVKTHNERVEGNALRAENEKLRVENLAMKELLKDESCLACKGQSFNKDDRRWILEQLRMENARLHEKHETACNLLANVGISVSLIQSQLAPPPGSSAMGAELLPRAPPTVGGLSLDCSLENFNPTMLQQVKEVQEFDRSQMIHTVANAIQELACLLVSDFLWIKDPTDGRYIIHRDNYEKTFLRINHLNTLRSRFESSKEEGIVSMNGRQLVGMLMDSGKRLDLFPTIIKNSMTIQELVIQEGIPANGSLQMVWEQMHVLSPLVAPREFSFLRYCQQMGEATWLIVEVSYDFLKEAQQNSPFRCWRFPSGCMIKEMLNGSCKVTWVEHVEVHDKSQTHSLYRDLVFRGLAYGAERWLLTLQRMCARFAREMLGTLGHQELGGVISRPEGRRSIMKLTHRMIKSLCTNLNMKRKVDNPQLSELNNSGIRVSISKTAGLGPLDSLIINAAASLWLPISPQALFDFFRDHKLRSQWDTLSDGNPFQEIENISYSDNPGNCISILQAIVSPANNMLVIQETYIDRLGALVVFAPVNVKLLDILGSGVDSSNVPVLPSGFIISGDGRPSNGLAGSSSSSSSAQPPRPPGGGSLLTVAFQILACGASSSSSQVDVQSVSSVSTAIGSTVENIKSALKCNGLG